MKLKLPIKYKILIGFATILFLSLLTQFIGFRITEQLVYLQTDRILSDKSQNAADQIQNFISKIELDHLGIAYIFNQEKDADSTKITDTLTYTLRQNTFFEKIAILSLTGRELAKADRFGITPKEKLYFEIPTDPFTKALKGQTGISKVYITENDSIPHIDLFTPIITERGGVLGVVKGQLRLDRLWDIIARSNIGKNGFSYVVDDEGRLIAHPNNDFVKKTPILNDRTIITHLLQKQSQIQDIDTQYTNEQSIRVIASGVKIPVLDWVVITEEPVNEALKELYVVRSIVFGTFIGSLILLIIFSLLVSEGVTRPIHTLKLFAEGIKHGAFESQVKIDSGDEVEELGLSLNLMNKQLKKYVAELSEKILLLEEQKKHLDHSTSLLIKRDEEVRQINQELEQEKEIISAERNKLEIILSGIQDAVIATDLEQKIILFNSAAQRLTGYAPTEVIGQPIENIIRLYENGEEIKKEIYTPIHNDDFEGILYEKKNIVLLGKGTDKLHVNISSGKIKESNASNLGCIITLQDLSQESVLEKMKIDFVSMAAHELRTPLTIIRGYTETLKEDAESHLTKDQNEFINRIMISAKALSDLIDNLLNVSHIEQGKFKINFAPLQLHPVIQETVNSFQSYIKSKEQELTCILPQELPVVMADKIRISQVLSNLIANAINYTPPKSKIAVIVSVLHDEKRTPHNYVQVSVRDTGQGIPRDALPHLFTKFFRVSGVLEQGSKGTGLGLFISKTIILLHHGEIWAESEMGVGSTFTFILPVATDEEKNIVQKKESGSDKHGIILNLER